MLLTQIYALSVNRAYNTDKVVLSDRTQVLLSLTTSHRGVEGGGGGGGETPESAPSGYCPPPASSTTLHILLLLVAAPSVCLREVRRGGWEEALSANLSFLAQRGSVYSECTRNHNFFLRRGDKG